MTTSTVARTPTFADGGVTVKLTQVRPVLTGRTVTYNFHGHPGYLKVWLILSDGHQESVAVLPGLDLIGYTFPIGYCGPAQVDARVGSTPERAHSVLAGAVHLNLAPTCHPLPTPTSTPRPTSIPTHATPTPTVAPTPSPTHTATIALVVATPPAPPTLPKTGPDVAPLLLAAVTLTALGSIARRIARSAKIADALDVDIHDLIPAADQRSA